MSSVPREKTFQNTLKDVKRRLSNLETATPLNSASIGSGGVTVKDEGGITVEDGGVIQANYPDSQGGGPALLIGPDEANVYTLKMFEPDGTEIFKIQGWNNNSEISALVEFIGLAAENIQLAYGGNQNFFATIRVGDSAFAPSVQGIALDTDKRIDLVATDGTRILAGGVASAANCHINSLTGLISESVSSRRYKQDIEDAVIDTEQALKLHPRRFRMKEECENDSEARAYVGFIAEEAAELGLDDWVTKDEDGPRSFSYGSWVVAQQAILQQQQETIQELRAEVASLREAVDSTKEERHG